MRFSSLSHTKPGLAPLEIDFAKDYVLGFPMHVAILVRCDQEEAVLRHLPFVDCLDTYGAIGLRLQNEWNHQEIMAFEPEFIVDEDAGIPEFALGPGETRRLLIDVSDLIPLETPAGDYFMRISYATGSTRVEHQPVLIVLRRPNAEEQGILGQIKPELLGEGRWKKWTTTPPRDLNHFTEQVTPEDPLRFNRILRFLFYSPQPLDQIDMTLLDGLDGIYYPEAMLFRAELLMARRDHAGFDRVATWVRQSCPGLSYWVDEIAAGQSPLADQRSLSNV
jgi:hypothetical protein